MNIGDFLHYNDIVGYGLSCPHCLSLMVAGTAYDIYEYHCGMKLNAVFGGYEIDGVCKFIVNYTSEKDDTVPVCNCDLFTVLMVKGCVCGKMEQERKLKDSE